jgi:hypothetical protein
MNDHDVSVNDALVQNHSVSDNPSKRKLPKGEASSPLLVKANSEGPLRVRCRKPCF